MKKKTIIICVLVLLALIGGVVFYLNRASGPGSQLDNYPYEPDTPAPDPHNGVFVSDHGKMIFNGIIVRIINDKSNFGRTA